MGVGPTLLGGIVGAAVGVALHLVLETGILGKPIEASWFAIVIGLLTGLGVRQANRTHMERSYLRGAISAALALAAIFTSTLLLAEYMKKRDAAAAAAQKTPVAANATAATADANDEATAEAGDSDEAATADTAAETSPNPLLAGEAAKGSPAGFNPWQFVFMALGALVAYEFGRGGSPKALDDRRGVPPEGLGRATDPSE